MSFLFYSDEITIDVQTGLVTRHFRVSYGIGIHAIAKDKYPRYRGPDGAEASDKGCISGEIPIWHGLNKRDGSSKARAVVFTL